MQVHQQRQPRLTLYLLAAVLIVTVPCAASDKATYTGSGHPLHVYHSLIPLGSEVFSYVDKNERETFYVMASAQDGEFAGDQIWLDGERHVLRNSHGALVESYPHQMRFRISVSDDEGFLPTDQPFPVEPHGRTFNDFISGLKFEMRVFHALKDRVIHPTQVVHIGMPPDVPSKERIYEVTFDIGDVPISDRIVMHVLTSEGDRLAKFNFDLY